MKTYQNPSDIFDDPTTPLFPLQLAVFLLPKKNLFSKYHSPFSLLATSVFFLSRLPFSLFSSFFCLCLPSQANHPLLHIPSVAPRAAHSKVVRETAKKIILIPRKPSSSGGGGLQYVLIVILENASNFSNTKIFIIQSFKSLEFYYIINEKLN